MEILFVIPKRFKRIMEEYLGEVEDQEIRDLLQEKVPAISEELQRELAMFTEDKTIFHYHVLEMALRKRKRSI